MDVPKKFGNFSSSIGRTGAFFIKMVVSRILYLQKVIFDAHVHFYKKWLKNIKQILNGLKINENYER
jgi:hypothetical protein